MDAAQLSWVVCFLSYMGTVRLVARSVDPTVAWGGTLASTAIMCVGYLIDRVRVQPEDIAQANAFAHHATATSWVPLTLAATFVAAGVPHLVDNPDVLVRAGLCGGVAIWYSIPLPLVGVRWKDAFPMSKTLFTGVMHASFLMITHRFSVSDLGAPELCAVVNFGVYYMCSSILMDVKDIHGDSTAGVVSWMTVLGATRGLHALSLVYACCTVGALALLPAAVATPFAVSYACLAGVSALHARAGRTPSSGALNLHMALPVMWASVL